MNAERYYFDVAIGSICLLDCVLATSFNVQAADEESTAETRAIAREAFIYGFPMVDGYRIQYA